MPQMVEQVGVNPHLTEFEFEGMRLPVTYVETLKVARGVICDVYRFGGDDKKDLGIIKIDEGFSTPSQKVLNGDKTIEGYISGEGRLIVTKLDGSLRFYKVGEENSDTFSINIGVGETMQWQAFKNSNLVVYEVCYPPYAPGRYENL